MGRCCQFAITSEAFIYFTNLHSLCMNECHQILAEDETFRHLKSESPSFGYEELHYIKDNE